MCAHKPEIVVAGGGIAGAAIALFLSRLNANVIVLEGRPGRPTFAEGGILMLAPNGMHVLGGLGLARTLLQRDSGVQVPWITINDSAGGHIGKVPQGSEERYGFASTMVMRSDLHDVLLDEVERKRLDVKWNAQVQSIEESDDGVLVRWIQDGLPHEKKADLLIGADGTWSTVRPSMYDCLGLSVPTPEYSGLVGLGALTNIDSVPGLSDLLTPDRPCVMIHGRQGFVGMAIFDRERKKVGWWTTHEAPNRTREEWKIPKKEALVKMRERYSDWAFPVPQLIAAAEASDDQLFVWPVFQVRKLERWHSRRTVLIGDAAHAMPPHSGQGASQALEDAGYLAYLLRAQIESAVSGTKELDWTPLLAQFQMDRQPRVNEIVDEANRRGSMKKDQSVLGYMMKKWIMWIMFMFMRESWGDGWFGYKVPGIDEW
ncbi:FAD/NAD(P)-binding domain-containing protein [Boletus edulis BED1]|uniref:FAD/NAD(P)-binding domain-containing protein n=1 Tax=Boletus edulis BED1 TaxID=1328754 RepID=A0AAD4C254_BOLED|nr:FAD/NAD(P)-binding domain-containing protein [Boletus edulis BED1]